ncbi:MAG: hypothetical protein QM758_25545 [Armatimonas sp.]
MKPVLFALAALALADGVPTIEPGDWVVHGDVKKSIPESGQLQFDYKVAPEDLSVILLPLAGGFGDAKTLKLEVKADGNRTVAVALEEKQGGRWTALVALPKDGWQKIELSESDFALSMGENDPKDPNNKLDLPKVQNLALFDMDGFFIKDKSPAAQLFFPDAIAGPRVLNVRNVAFSEAAPAAPAGLDGLARPQASWLPIGGLRIRKVETSPLEGVALEAKYRSGAMRVGGLMRPLVPGALVGKKALMLNVASEKSISLIVQLEDDRGAKWNVPIEVPGEKKKKSVRLALTDWQASQDSKDQDAKMDLARIKQISLIDPSGLASQTLSENTVWLSGLTAQ